jgi:high-affinity nickel-transport protein
MNEVEVGLIVAAVLYGFRHGFDLDHLAALGDITGSSADRDRALRLSTLYVIGHALVVFALGMAAIVVGAYIPASWDALMGQVIGVTLLALGLYLIYSIVRYRGSVRLRSRWMLAADGVRAASRRLRRTERTVVIEHSHEHSHDGTHEHGHPKETFAGRSVGVPVATAHAHAHTHVATLPEDPFRGYSAPAAFGVGMIHGIGAETPTQILLFASAAGAGTIAGGIAVLASFLVGLVVANTLVAVTSAFGFTGRKKFPWVYLVIAAATAAFSLYLGITYLLGSGDPISRLSGS